MNRADRFTDPRVAWIRYFHGVTKRNTLPKIANLRNVFFRCRVNKDDNISRQLAQYASSFAEYSQTELLMKLNELYRPVSYAANPSKDEQAREGNRLWVRIRPLLAELVCKNRKKGGDARLGALLIGGASAFIQEIAKQILGSGVLPDVTSGVAAAAAGLLYKELQNGIDEFCEAYSTSDSNE